MFSKTSRTVSILLVLLLILITSITVYSISFETKAALKGSVQEKLMTVAVIAAYEIDGDSFARLQAGEEDSLDFIRIRDQLHRVKEASPDIRFIYTMRKSGDTVEFVVDGEYGYSNDAANIGESYPQAGSELLAGFFGPSADEEFTTDQWGTVLSGYSPIRDSSGAVIGIVGVDMDSSVVMAKLNRINMILYLVGILVMVLAALGILFNERRRAIDERNLEASEKKYRLLFERAGDSILMIEAEGDNQGKIIAANTAAAEMHGYSLDEMFIKNIADLYPPESRKGLTHLAERLLNDEWLKDETLHIRKDGRVFPVEMNASLLDLGTKKYLLTLERDISERKRVEEELRKNEKQLASIYETVGDVIFLLDIERDGNYRFASVNPAFSTTTGISPDSIIGKSVNDVIPEPSLSLVLGKYRQAIAEKTIVRWEETTLYSKGRLSGEVSVAPVFDKNGNCTHLVGAVHDITDRKKAEESLQIARKKLNLLNVITFQDLQSALFSLSSYLELMKTGIWDKTHMTYLEKGRGLLTRTASLMNFAKDYQSMGITPPRWQNVSQVFLYAISHLPPLTMERIITVGGLEIYADPLLETAFLNLVGSMQKYGAGATIITLKYEEPGDHLVVILEQNGAGVPAEEKEHFFERGYDEGHEHGLFLAREVLSITGIAINETGIEGKEIRFEMLVPKGAHRFPDEKN
jgi:PAS domain S-box-containing protein